MCIRNVPPGQCTYACVYCCQRDTLRQRTRPRAFHPTADIVSAVHDRLSACTAEERPQFLAFIHGGEPTLDARLGAQIVRLLELGLPVAVLTNGSLLWRPGVRAELMAAHRVLVKLDTVDARTWHRVNRPAAQLRLPRVLAGIEAFRAEYPGRFDTETTVVADMNDAPAQLAALADFLARLAPDHAWLTHKRTDDLAPTPPCTLTDVRDLTAHALAH